MKKLPQSITRSSRKVLIVLLAVLLMVNTLTVAVPGSAATVYAEELQTAPVISEDGTAVEYGQLRFSLQSNHAVVTGCTENLSGAVEIPSSVSGLPVAAIGDSAFAGQSGITELRLPETVMVIGNCAFMGCSQLSVINIPDGVVSTGVDAFAGCPAVTVVNRCEDGLVTVIAGRTPTQPHAQPEADYSAVLFTDSLIPTHYNASAEDYPEGLLPLLMDGMLSFVDEIDVEDFGITVPQLDGLLDVLESSAPIEYAAAGVSHISYSYYPSSQLVASITFFYTSPTVAADYPARYAALKDKIDFIFEAIDSMTVYEKLLYVHDYLVLNGQYDTNYERYDAYDILVDGIGVCQAYTLAYQLIMDLCGIPNVRAISDEMNHTWNLVCIDGEWYQIDVTWDDPVPDRPGRVYYSNFVLTDAELTDTGHYEWLADYTCTSDTYSDTPRGTNATQYYYNGRWYLYDSTGKSIVSCDIFGNDLRTVVASVSGGIAVHDGVLYYGSGTSIIAMPLAGSGTSVVYTLSAAEQANSDNPKNGDIYSISMDESGILSYSYIAWKISSVNGSTINFTGSIVNGSNTVDVSRFSVSVPATSISLDRTAVTVLAGKTAVVTASVSPAGFTDEVTWGSSDENVATVAGGLIYAENPGTAVITATAGSATATCVVTVTVPASAIELDCVALELAVGQTGRLTSAVTPEKYSEYVVWSSSDDGVATVSGGVVTAVAPGTATVTAKVGSVSAACTVTVTAPATAIKLSETSLALSEGDSATLTATVTPANSTDNVVWFTSDKNIATVVNGKITAVAAGKVTVTATAGAHSASCEVTVSHVYSSVVTPPTCDKEGYTTNTCSVCGDSNVSDMTAAIGHDYTSAVTKAATCTEDGVITFTCRNDSKHTYTEPIKATGHTEVTDPAVAPTETATGLTEGSHCEICGHVIVAQQVIPATGSPSEPQDYDVSPNINGGASKLYEPWGLRYFAVYNGADIDKITDRGIVILKDKYYTDSMTPETFAAHENAFVYLESKGELGFETPTVNNPNGRYYATLTEGIYSYDISAYYYVVPFAVMEDGQTVYGTIKKNSMEKILNTNLGLTSISATEKDICTCILQLKNSVADHYAASGVPGASIDMDVPRGSTQTAAGSLSTPAQSGITPNIVAGASRLIEPWGLRYFATFTENDSIADRGAVILCEKYFKDSYTAAPDKMRLDANAYVFTQSGGTLQYESASSRYYATLTEGISSKDIADVYYVVPYAVMNDGSYVYGTVKKNSMINIMNINLNLASVPETEKAVSRDIIALYNAVKAYYAAQSN